MTDRTYTDPAGMPEDERMTPAEFQMTREFLGLSGPWLAKHLGVSYKTIQHWQTGRYPVPDGVRLRMEDLERRTGDYIGMVVEQVMDVPDPVLVTYRTDEEYAAADPSSPMPASWHRMVVARVALEVPALSVVYADAVQHAHVRQGAR